MAVTFDILQGRLGLDTSGWHNALKAAQPALQSFTSNMQRSLDVLKAGAKNLEHAFIGLAGGLTAIFAESLKAAGEEVAAEKRLAATLKATGDAAGRTKEQMEKMADQISRTTNFSKDAVTHAQAMLVVFRSVKGDNFDKVTKAAADMAAVLREDLEGAIFKVGKAMEDPILGLTMLRRSGILFSTQQQEQIKNWVELGQLEKAQGIILQELSAKFGGAAENMANPWIKMTNAVDKAFAAIGKLVLPLKNELADAIGRIANSTTAWVKANDQLIHGQLDKLRDILTSLRDRFMELPKFAQYAIELGAAFLVFKKASGAIGGLIGMIEKLPVVGEIFGKLAHGMMAIVNPFTWLGGATKLLLALFSPFGVAVAAIAAAALVVWRNWSKLAPLWETLGRIGEKLWELFVRIGEVLSTMAGWVIDDMKPGFEGLGEVVLWLVDTVFAGLVKMLQVQLDIMEAVVDMLNGDFRRGWLLMEQPVMFVIGLLKKFIESIATMMEAIGGPALSAPFHAMADGLDADMKQIEAKAKAVRDSLDADEAARKAAKAAAKKAEEGGAAGGAEAQAEAKATPEEIEAKRKAAYERLSKPLDADKKRLGEIHRGADSLRARIDAANKLGHAEEAAELQGRLDEYNSKKSKEVEELQGRIGKRTRELAETSYGDEKRGEVGGKYAGSKADTRGTPEQETARMERDAKHAEQGALALESRARTAKRLGKHDEADDLTAQARAQRRKASQLANKAHSHRQEIGPTPEAEEEESPTEAAPVMLTKKQQAAAAKQARQDAANKKALREKEISGMSKEGQKAARAADKQGAIDEKAIYAEQQIRKKADADFASSHPEQAKAAATGEATGAPAATAAAAAAVGTGTTASARQAMQANNDAKKAARQAAKDAVAAARTARKEAAANRSATASDKAAKALDGAAGGADKLKTAEEAAADAAALAAGKQTPAQAAQAFDAKAMMDQAMQHAQGLFQQGAQAAGQVAQGAAAKLAMGPGELNQMIEDAKKAGNPVAALDLIIQNVQAKVGMASMNLHNLSDSLGSTGSAFGIQGDNSAYQASINSPAYQALKSFTDLLAQLQQQRAGLVAKMAKGKHMATGGITVGPMHALIGEDGPEAVIPLTNLWSQLQQTLKQNLGGTLTAFTNNFSKWSSIISQQMNVGNFANQGWLQNMAAQNNAMVQSLHQYQEHSQINLQPMRGTMVRGGTNIMGSPRPGMGARYSGDTSPQYMGPNITVNVHGADLTTPTGARAVAQLLVPHIDAVAKKLGTDMTGQSALRSPASPFNASPTAYAR